MANEGLALGSGFLRGFGGEFIRQKDVKQQQEREDFQRSERFLLETLDRPDLSPEGRQFVLGAWKEMIGKGGKGGKGKSTQQLSDIIDQLYGEGGAPQPGGGGPGGPQPHVERSTPEAVQAQGVSRGTPPQGGGSPYFRDPLQTERSQLEMRGEVQRGHAQAGRDTRAEVIDQMVANKEIDPATAAVMKGQIQTGMNIPSRRADPLTKVYDERTGRMTHVPQSQAAYMPAEGPKETPYTQQGEVSQFIANRTAFYQQTAPGMTEADMQTAISQDLNELEQSQQQLQDIDRQAKQALINARNRANQGQDRDGLSTRQAVTIAHNSAMRMAQIGVELRMKHDMQFQQQVRENPAIVEAQIQGAYEDILINNFGIPIEQIQAVVGGAVNQPGAGAGAGPVSGVNPNFVPEGVTP